MTPKTFAVTVALFSVVGFSGLVGGCACDSSIVGAHGTDGGDASPDGVPDTTPPQCDPIGGSCEFDSDCCVVAPATAGFCIGGICTTDPRGTTCVHNVDCPIGFLCVAGTCNAATNVCVVDTDCTGGASCVGGTCRTDCPADPGIAGPWYFYNDLPIRDALPGWLATILGAIGDTFRVLTSSGSDSWEAIVAAVIMSVLPTWAWDLWSGLADLNDILSNWYIDSTVTFTNYAPRDYHATETWDYMGFYFRSMWLWGTPRDVLGSDVMVSPYDAHVTCGVVNLDRHDVALDLRRVVLWVINEVTCVITESAGLGCLTLADAIRTLSTNFCQSAADAADPGHGATYFTVLAGCNSALSDATSSLLDALDPAHVWADTISLQGTGALMTPIHMEPGTWQGSLSLAGDFVGTFTADKVP